MEVSQKVYGFIFSVAISGIMSLVMSFFMIWVNVGFTDAFLWAWFYSTILGFTVSLPVAMFTIPVVQLVLNKYLKIKH